MNGGSPEEKRGVRILVVEDEESIQRGLCDVLAFHGHAPDAVANGEDGLSQARSQE